MNWPQSVQLDQTYSELTIVAPPKNIIIEWNLNQPATVRVQDEDNDLRIIVEEVAT